LNNQARKKMEGILKAKQLSDPVIYQWMGEESVVLVHNYKCFALLHKLNTDHMVNFLPQIKPQESPYILDYIHVYRKYRKENVEINMLEYLKKYQITSFVKANKEIRMHEAANYYKSEYTNCGKPVYRYPQDEFADKRDILVDKQDDNSRNELKIKQDNRAQLTLTKQVWEQFNQKPVMCLINHHSEETQFINKFETIGEIEEFNGQAENGVDALQKVFEKVCTDIYDYNSKLLSRIARIMAGDFILSFMLATCSAGTVELIAKAETVELIKFCIRKVTSDYLVEAEQRK